MEERLKKQSRALSWLLRHGAVEAGVTMDAAGWVAVTDVLRALGMTRTQLDEIVRTNDKRRLELEGERVRACQGHSTEGTPVTVEALEATWTVHEGDGPLWHGTSASALPAIAREGLLPLRRTHVHLASALDSVVGKRAAVDVMLEIDPARVRAEGQRIFVAPNGVVLVRRVPRVAIVGLRAMTRRSRAREQALRTLLLEGSA